MTNRWLAAEAGTQPHQLRTRTISPKKPTAADNLDYLSFRIGLQYCQPLVRAASVRALSFAIS
jgi:hypothetical protein